MEGGGGVGSDKEIFSEGFVGGFDGFSVTGSSPPWLSDEGISASASDAWVSGGVVAGAGGEVCPDEEGLVKMMTDEEQLLVEKTSSFPYAVPMPLVAKARKW